MHLVVSVGGLRRGYGLFGAAVLEDNLLEGEVVGGKGQREEVAVHGASQLPDGLGVGA